ncbi:hypothetical protein HYFRA_00013561 [Hymenoscyphus fraxineus]|uniref:Uncharacterized protein n=1 Tax=Hymenoscyphus fraxineus TaxID=746836 RepID=A0A9N9Q108_9HELO|nr:hypothetical protein HYFRA_00013561 [Hymenoscyphus fraxineus]
MVDLSQVGSTFNAWHMLSIPLFSFALDTGALFLTFIAGATVPILTINTEKLKLNHWHNTQTNFPLHDVYKLYPLSYGAYNYIDDARAKLHTSHDHPEFRAKFDMSRIISDNSAKASFQNSAADGFKIPIDIQNHFTRNHHFAKNAGLLLILVWFVCVVSNWVAYFMWRKNNPRPKWHWRRMLCFSIGSFTCSLSIAAILSTLVDQGEAVFNKHKSTGIYAKGDGLSLALYWMSFLLTVMSMTLWFFSWKAYHDAKEEIRDSVRPQLHDNVNHVEDDRMGNNGRIQFLHVNGGGIELHEMPPIPEESESINSASNEAVSLPPATVLPTSSESSKDSQTKGDKANVAQPSVTVRPTSSKSSKDGSTVASDKSKDDSEPGGVLI